MDYLDISVLEKYWTQFTQACFQGCKLVSNRGVKLSEIEMRFDMDAKKFVHFVHSKNRNLCYEFLRGILLGFVRCDERLLCYCRGKEYKYSYTSHREISSMAMPIAIALVETMRKTQDCWVRLTEDKKMLEIVGCGDDKEEEIYYGFCCFGEADAEPNENEEPLVFEINVEKKVW